MPFVIPAVAGIAGGISSALVGTAAITLPAAVAGPTVSATAGLIGAGGVVKAGMLATTALVGGGLYMGHRGMQTAQAGAEYAAKSAVAQARSEAAILEYNRQVTEQQARQKEELLKRAGKIAYDEKLDERRRFLASLRVRYRGVMTEGTPLLAEIESAKNLTLDAITTKYNVSMGIQGIRTEAQSASELYKLKATSAMRAGKLSAGQALFSGRSQRLAIGTQMVGMGINYALNR